MGMRRRYVLYIHFDSVVGAVSMSCANLLFCNALQYQQEKKEKKSKDKKKEKKDKKKVRSL